MNRVARNPSLGVGRSAKSMFGSCSVIWVPFVASVRSRTSCPSPQLRPPRPKYQGRDADRSIESSPAGPDQGAALIVRGSLCASRLVTGGTGERAGPIGIDAYVDDLGVLNGEDLVAPFGWGGAGSLGRAGQAEADHDGIAIDLDAFDACLYAVGQQVSIPVENLAAVGEIGRAHV